MKRALLVTSLLLASAAVTADRTLYIQSPAAKLLGAPRMDAGIVPLARGDKVTQTGEEGAFYKVVATPGSGFVPKLFASAFPPGQKVNFGGSIDKDTSAKARARASNYSETASARGLSDSQTLRTRGGIQDFDFDSVEWLERIDISAKDVEQFEKVSGKE